MSTLLTIRNFIPSRGLRAGLYRSPRRTGNSWNTPAPPVIGIWNEATYSRGRSTVRGETVRRSQRHHPDGELKSKLGCGIPRFPRPCTKSRGFSVARVVPSRFATRDFGQTSSFPTESSCLLPVLGHLPCSQ